MKKVALVFVLAVFVPSLVLAWLAVRSLRDQQFVLERQQSLLYQGVADALAKVVGDVLSDCQREFGLEVERLMGQRNAREAGVAFDERLRTNWPLAEVGFAVTLAGEILSPSPYGRPEARAFCANNGLFLGNREIAEVYWNTKVALNVQQAAAADALLTRSELPAQERVVAQQVQPPPQVFGKAASLRNVAPQQQFPVQQSVEQTDLNLNPFSKLSPAEAEFRQLIGDSTEGTLARFLENRLHLLFWYRSPRDPNLVFGAQVSLARLMDELRDVMQRFGPGFREEICLAILDDNARPVALSVPGFQASWKRPFVATEIGEALPHWEAAVYLLDPNRLAKSARTVKLTLGLLIAVLVLAIGVGSWLIVADLKRQLTLARQKTDFVSNVSHELKTPLTSIRMFAELLAEERVADRDRRRSYLSIITSEAARLTRLINNVLDFSRLERGEKKYNFASCDLTALARETADTYRPHLESNGFRLDCELPTSPILVNADRDALAQVIVNLLSNAEKYSDSRKQILLQVERRDQPLPHAEVRVLDRGPGVPRGCEEKIFEQFYRAHDSLSSGIQGSGLGLTLARQIARAHGGDVMYEPRAGGGSCFILRLPMKPNATTNEPESTRTE